MFGLFKKPKKQYQFNLKPTSTITRPKPTTDKGGEQIKLIEDYLKDQPKAKQEAGKWLLFDSNRYYDFPSQLFQQIHIYQSKNLDGTSVTQDPLVAVEIFDSDPKTVKELVAANKDQAILEEVEPYNTDLYNKRVFGILMYEVVAKELLVNALHKQVKSYRGYIK